MVALILELSTCVGVFLLQGKDRYPYPVGYRSIRIQNGTTYKMEILEGLKGPLFTISSSDGNSCSGDTPDIAWENFQKKSCCRVKLWRGKRFSCKVDGVEFYGFKNPFVQRLLRELAANNGGTEHKPVTSDFSTREHDITKLETAGSTPDSLPCLVKTQVTRKRRRTGKVIDAKRIDETPIVLHQHAEFMDETKAINSSQKDISDGRGGFCTIDAQNAADMEENGKCLSLAETGMQSDSMNMSDHLKEGALHSVQKSKKNGSSQPTGLDVNGCPVSQEAVSVYAQNAAVKEENGKYLSLAETGMQSDSVDMSDHLKVGGLRSVQKSENNGSFQLTGLDVNGCPASQEASGGPLSQETGGAINSQQGKPLLDDNLCAPDTMDYVGDSLNAYPLDNHEEQTTCNVKDANVNNVSNSEIAVTDSHPEGEMGTSSSSTFSEKCDIDSDSQEVVRSMIELLLPRAVPLLKTFSRRKKKKSSKSLSSSIDGFEKKNDMPNLNTDDGCISRELAEQPDLERQKAMASVSCTRNDSFVSTSGGTGCVVPDSLEYDGPEYPLQNAFKADKVSDRLGTPSQLPLSPNGKGTALLCLDGSKEKEINLQEEPENYLSEQPHKDAFLPPEKVLAKSKSAEKPHNISASTGESSPTLKNMTCRSSKSLELPKINVAGLADKLPNNAGLADLGVSVPKLQNSSTSHFHNVSVKGQREDGCRLNIQQPSIIKISERDLLDLFACYVFPMPISMVQMIAIEDAIYLCVVCGALEHDRRTLFVYRVLKRGESLGCPSLIGYIPLGLEFSKDDLGGDITVYSSLLQFTPDAQLLVLANNIRTPYCRESKLHCLCSVCASGCFKKNAIKIVQLCSGYVSLVTRLETTEDVRCLLVCAPHFLLAAAKGGKLKLWVMNSSWSEQLEECYLPTSDCMVPCLVELKRVPLSDNLVIGHNGFGEFGLWDIYKRTLVSRFSSPGMSVSRCISCGIFRWKNKGANKTEELIVNEIMDATKLSFKGKSENTMLSPDDKDVAIWLLISTVSDPDLQCYRSSEQQEKSAEYWQLALLVNNTVIIGSVLGQGAAAVTPAGHGIIGTCDGVVYMWELSTGKKLANLHSFRGSSVSCVSTDTSNSGAVAVASGDQLLVYLPS